LKSDICMLIEKQSFIKKSCFDFLITEKSEDGKQFDELINKFKYNLLALLNKANGISPSSYYIFPKVARLQFVTFEKISTVIENNRSFKYYECASSCTTLT